jgi:hypothetical protein
MTYTKVAIAGVSSEIGKTATGKNHGSKKELI